MEAKPIGTTNSAISANNKDIARKNVGNRLRKTNPATTPRAKCTGPEFT